MHGRAKIFHVEILAQVLKLNEIFDLFDKVMFAKKISLNFGLTDEIEDSKEQSDYAKIRKCFV